MWPAVQPCDAAIGGGPSQLQSARLVAAVAGALGNSEHFFREQERKQAPHGQRRFAPLIRAAPSGRLNALFPHAGIVAIGPKSSQKESSAE